MSLGGSAAICAAEGACAGAPTKSGVLISALRGVIQELCSGEVGGVGEGGKADQAGATLGVADASVITGAVDATTGVLGPAGMLVGIGPVDTSGASVLGGPPGVGLTPGGGVEGEYTEVEDASEVRTVAGSGADGEAGDGESGTAMSPVVGA